jgi:hypothetical protein
VVVVVEEEEEEEDARVKACQKGQAHECGWAHEKFELLKWEQRHKHKRPYRVLCNVLRVSV